MLTCELCGIEKSADKFVMLQSGMGMFYWYRCKACHDASDDKDEYTHRVCDRTIIEEKYWPNSIFDYMKRLRVIYGNDFMKLPDDIRNLLSVRLPH